MPKRTDIHRILLIGSGPIRIGQACEFDYSGTQAAKALLEEKYEVILINSNPATIMTDPAFATRVYIEPLTIEFLKHLIEKEKPDALLPTMGGQTALNLSMSLYQEGFLQKAQIKIIGASPASIKKAENRECFKNTMTSLGFESPKSILVHNLQEAKTALKTLGLPLILRPSFTLGGEGGGVVPNEEVFFKKLKQALFLSPVQEVLLEESLVGWKEFELEVIRDSKDNAIVVCSIENFDPMGVHTGDSITIAPAQTLTDREYQNLRNQALAIIRAIGVETGGSNIQFAIHPKTGRVLVIEMNPRVSRSSALASKATGFPIARIAAKLAVGYTLDELTNAITQTTPASFEPVLDYVVTKIPRFDFEKIPPATTELTTQMKSVGEVMAIGSSFEESLFKALSSLELATIPQWIPIPECVDWEKIKTPSPERIFEILRAFRKGISIANIAEATQIDPWFLERLSIAIDSIKKFEHIPFEHSTRISKAILELKQKGFSDKWLAELWNQSEEEVRKKRTEANIHTSFHFVDTCAAEFEAKTPYFYSSYFGTNEIYLKRKKPSVLVLGGGPNRIGQGIEFDYCCVHAAFALKELGYETVMVNCNPETVSTDFDISDRLYFEPLTLEHVLEITDLEKPHGILIQFGGQTPLKLALALEKHHLPILGTPAYHIDQAEDRKHCEALVRTFASLGLKQPEATIAFSEEQAIQKANQMGYPVLVRPSYVLGGRGMRILHSEKAFKHWLPKALHFSQTHPLLIDRFLERAIEIDVDAVSDGNVCLIGGILEHIEEAGIHSGDSSCVFPAVSLAPSVLEKIRTFTRLLAQKLHIVGLLNIQFAIQNEEIYLLEINPRASRTIPFLSKATRFSLAKIATKVMLGKTLLDLGYEQDFDQNVSFFSVKYPIFPFEKFPNVDVLLGPEMKSTGEVMGRSQTFPQAYVKGILGANYTLPKNGAIFLSVRDEDKVELLPLAKKLKTLGFHLVATKGTARFLNENQIPTESIHKVKEGPPHCVEAIEKGRFGVVINTTSDEKAIRDSFTIRRAALEKKVPYCTVLSSARAMVEALAELQKQKCLEVFPL